MKNEKDEMETITLMTKDECTEREGMRGNEESDTYIRCIP